MKKMLLRLLLAAVLVVACFFLNRNLQKIEETAIEDVQAGSAASAGRHSYDTPADIGHPAMRWFGETFAKRGAFLGFTGDVTEDGLEDLVILFHEDGITDICWMCVAVQRNDGGWAATEPVRAPVENQKIRMYNMDDEAPLEWVVTGEKDGEVGYAIFRLIDGSLKNLFAEGMEDCC